MLSDRGKMFEKSFSQSVKNWAVYMEWIDFLAFLVEYRQKDGIDTL